MADLEFRHPLQRRDRFRFNFRRNSLLSPPGRLYSYIFKDDVIISAMTICVKQNTYSQLKFGSLPAGRLAASYLSLVM